MKKVRKTKFLSVLLALAMLVTMISGTCFASDAGDTDDGNAPDAKQEEIISDDKEKEKDTETEEPKTEEPEAEGEKDPDIQKSSSSEPASQSDEEPDSLIKNVYKGSDTPSTMSGDDLVNYIANVIKGNENNTKFTKFTPTPVKYYQENQQCVKEINVSTPKPQDEWPITYITVKADLQKMKAYQLTYGGNNIEDEPRKYYNLVMNFNDDVNVADLEEFWGVNELENVENFGGTNNKSIVLWLDAEYPSEFMLTTDGLTYQDVRIQVVNYFDGVTVVPGEMHTTLNTVNNEKLAAVISDIEYKASEIKNTVWVSENIKQIIKPDVLQDDDELRLDYTVSAIDINADGTVTSYTVDVVPVIYRNGQTIKITKDQMSNPSNLKVAFNIPVPDAFANKYAKADVVHNNTEDLGTFTVQDKSYIQVTTTGFSPFKITGVDTAGNASKTAGTVKTGDAANITLWMLLMALAAAAGIIVFKKRTYIK